MRSFPPERIVCLTAETVEVLYLLGEDARIVGVTGFATRPARVRREKPRVSGFSSADISAITALEPDLVLSFCDIQADITAALLREGVAVMAFNQQDLRGILAMIRHVGALVGCPARADDLARGYEARLAEVAARAEGRARPLVYFEEWDEPMITAVRWVSELIGIAGGREAFPDLVTRGKAMERVVTPEQVVAVRPDVILGSWCGKKLRPERMIARPGWDVIPAVRDGRIHEISSSLILQPGPAALTEGLDAIIEALG